MRPIKIVAAVAAIVLLVGWGAAAAYADQANGSYSFDFTGIVALWDISGSYSGDLGNFALEFSITEKPNGKLNGDGTFSVLGQSLAGTITSIGGGMMGSSADPHVAIDLRMSGKGTLDGKDVRVSVSANLHYDLDSAAGDLDHGSGSGTVTEPSFRPGRPSAKVERFDAVRYRPSTCRLTRRGRGCCRWI